jgi:hypothetical protein
MRAPAAVALILALGAVIAGAANAQTGRWREPTPAISGAWRFETAIYDRDCRMRGQMTLRRSSESGIYDCRLVAFERCPDQENAEINSEVEQVCRAVRNGEQLTITSEIVRMKEESPYQPDDFELVIRSGLLMQGELRSADIAPVEFRREPGPMS